MATTTAVPAETTFGCDLLARPSLCAGDADTVVVTASGPVLACGPCAAERAELTALDVPGTEVPF